LKPPERSARLLRFDSTHQEMHMTRPAFDEHASAYDSWFMQNENVSCRTITRTWAATDKSCPRPATQPPSTGRQAIR
jgi:hypothetical protein